MNKIIVFLLFQLLVFSTKAQNKYAIYGNAGIAVNTNFDFKPTHNVYADLGFRYYFYKGLSVSLEVNTAFFKQSINFDKFIANYYTQTNSLGVVLMNETKISQRSYIGLGVGASMGYFYGRVFAQDELLYYQLTGSSKIKFNEIFPTFKGQIIYKRHLNKFLDAQLGLSYHYAQSYFLDMYTDVTNKKYDNFTVLFVGAVLKFGGVNYYGKGVKNSKKMKCPSF